MKAFILISAILLTLSCASTGSRDANGSMSKQHPVFEKARGAYLDP